MIDRGDNLPDLPLVNRESPALNQLSAVRPDSQPCSQTRGGRLSIDIEHVSIKSVIRALTSYGLCVTTIGGRLTVREAK